MYAAAIHHGPRSIHGLARHLFLFVLLMLAAMQAAAGSLALAWDPVNDPRVAGYKIHYGTASGNYTAQMDTGNVTTSTVPNLVDGATYYFAVTAYDGSLVQSGFSNEVAGTVPAAPVGAPVANFSASTTSGTAPLAMNFTSTSTGSITTYAWTFGDGTSSTAQNPTKTYTTAGSYTVALTVTGTGGSNTKTVPNYITVTAAPDTVPPSVPSGLTGTATSSTSVSLRWNASTDNVGVTGYRVFRCEGSTCTNFAQVGAPTGTTFTNTGLNGATAYSYAVKAIDAAGNLSAYSTTFVITTPAGADTTPPSAPSGVTATASGSSIINLSWTASTDNVGVTGYRVERCTGANCATFAQIATPTGTTFSNTGLAGSTSYSYRVRAVDAAGNLSAYSGIASATTAAPPVAAPTANFTATPVSGTAPLTVNFTSTSSGTIDTYAWDFGDGTTSTVANPSKVYSVPGTYTVVLTVTGPGGSNTITKGNVITVSSAPAASAGILSGSLTSASSGTIDLTSIGSSDWVQWPTGARKATGNGKISNYALVGASSAGTYGSDRRAMRWTDGSPIASGSSNEGTAAGGGIGKGFQLTVPADTTTRTLVIYVGTANSTGKLTATLSDRSAPDYVNVGSTRITKSWDGYYTLTYRAASAGQSLTVLWTVDKAKFRTNSSSVRMQGAALK